MKKLVGKRKSLLLGIAVLLAALLLAGLLILIWNNQQSGGDRATLEPYAICDDDEFYTMVVVDQIYISDKIDEFRPVVEKIQSTEGHESSPNCMFMLTMYAINTGDRQRASENYQAWGQVFSEKGGYTGTWKDTNVQTPDDLKPTIEFLENDDFVNGGPVEWDGAIPE